MDALHNIRMLYLRYLRYRWHILKYIGSAVFNHQEVLVADRVPYYKEMWMREAEELGACLQELARGVWKVSLGNDSTLIYNHKVQLDDTVVSSIAAHKPLCYAMLEKHGIPVPRHFTFRYHEIKNGKRFMGENGGLFVVKPAIGTSAGAGVTTHIRTYREFFKAVALASTYCKEVIIERMVAGECYRLLVLNGRMVHAVRRRGVRVIGDGMSTIRQLVGKDIERFRKLTGGGSDTGIDRDLDLSVTLRAQGLSIDSVPAAGRTVLVKSLGYRERRNVEVRTVYDEDVTILIGNDLREKAEETAEIFHSRFCGIDVITADPAVSLEASGGVINEINSNPGLHHHYDIVNPGEISPARHVLKHLLKANS